MEIETSHKWMNAIKGNHMNYPKAVRKYWIVATSTEMTIAPDQLERVEKKPGGLRFETREEAQAEIDRDGLLNSSIGLRTHSVSSFPRRHEPRALTT